MISMVIGRGQIGRAVAEVLAREDTVLTYDRSDDKLNYQYIDIIHICFPYSETFVEDVREYEKIFGEKPIVIWSTVPVGTTRKIDGAVHSPVEGVHPKLAESIRKMTRWVGANDNYIAEYYIDYFGRFDFKTEIVENSDFTEFLKLRSTSKYGINIVWAYYEAQVAKQLGMDYKRVQDFDRDYNALYHELGMNWAQRYILDEPTGKIGGHCVVPNAELLDEQFPSELLKLIKEMK